MPYIGNAPLFGAISSDNIVDGSIDTAELKDSAVTAAKVASGDYDHSHEIFARCVAGEFGPVAEYVPPPEPVVVEKAAP